MSTPEQEDTLEIIVGLMEIAKQHDENIQKTLITLSETVEREKKALQSLRNDVVGVTGRVVAEEVRNALKTQNSALETYFYRIDSITRQMQQAKRDLNLQNGLFYFGSFAVFMAMVFGFMFGFIPSMDEIRERRAELTALNSQIANMHNVKRLQVSQCSKQMCVKIIESQCNYGKKGNRYCVAQLK